MPPDGWSATVRGWRRPTATISNICGVSQSIALQALRDPGMMQKQVDALTLNKIAEAAGTKIDPNCNPASEDFNANNNCYYHANDLHRCIAEFPLLLTMGFPTRKSYPLLL